MHATKNFNQNQLFLDNIFYPTNYLWYLILLLLHAVVSFYKADCFVCLSVSVFLFDCMSVCLSVCLSFCLSFALTVSLSVDHLC